jgi:nucleoid-associated protein YgaU
MLPVLPEKVTVSYGSNNTKMQVYGVGEVTIIQDSAAATITFSSFFPRHYFQGCNYVDIPNPADAVAVVNAMKNSKKPVRFTVPGGLGLSMYVTISEFETWEVGGDPETIQYTIKMVEYREITMRQIRVNTVTKRASISSSAVRVDNTPAPQTYTVQKNDCLWNIAKKYLGSGSKYTAIVNANQTIFAGRNPNLIYPGETLTIPAA